MGCGGGVVTEITWAVDKKQGANLIMQVHTRYDRLRQSTHNATLCQATAPAFSMENIAIAASKVVVHSRKQGLYCIVVNCV